MSTYWDIITVNIANSTGFPISVGQVAPLPHGSYGTWPVSSIANNSTASPAFDARSESAAEVGPGPGTIVYDFPDGTQLNIQWDMDFAVLQPTYVSAQTGGPAGANYTVTVDCSQDSWHGQGKRYTATLTVKAGNTSHNSDQCTKT
jgi:hypothetical protein